MSLTQIIILLIVSLVILVVIIFLGTGVTSAPYVPTASKDLAKDLGRILSFKKTDLLIDLGAGDGKVLAATSKNGAKALGIELNPIMAFPPKFAIATIKILRCFAAISTASDSLKRLQSSMLLQQRFILRPSITKYKKRRTG